MEHRPRSLVVWEARHDNGWSTVVAEQKGGKFAAWATNGENTQIDFTGTNVAHASAAALAALRRKSGHRRCSMGCSDWAIRPES